MRWITLTLITLLCHLGAAYSQKQDGGSKGNRRIAVLELSNPAGLSKQEVDYLSDLLRQLASSELAQSFLVMDKANILTLLPPEKSIEDCIGSCAVETGRLLQAAYIITGDIIRFGKQLRVTVKLHDTRSGRLIGSEVASGREVTDMESGIQEAGGRLLRRLISKSDQGSGAATRQVIGGGGKSAPVGSARRVIVTLRSTPEGAGVTIDGVQKCAEGRKTCQVELTEGAHQVRMSKTDHFERSGSVTITSDQREVEWRLDPSFATLSVSASPEGLRYMINGESRSGDHTQRIKLGAPYRVVSDDRCYEQVGEEVKAGKPGDQLKVSLKPSKRYATLDLSARDPSGQPLDSSVYIDGAQVGSTPTQLQVWVCASRLRVSHSEHGDVESSLSLSAGEVKREVITLNDSAGVRAGRFNSWGWASLVGALASAGLGVYGYLKLVESEDEFPSTIDNPTRYDEMKSQFNTSKVLVYGGVGGAVALGITSIVFFSKSSALSSSEVRVSVTPIHDGAFGSLQWRW
jgi:TolB-like protein